MTMTYPSQQTTQNWIGPEDLEDQLIPAINRDHRIASRVVQFARKKGEQPEVILKNRFHREDLIPLAQHYQKNC